MFKKILGLLLVGVFLMGMGLATWAQADEINVFDDAVVKELLALGKQDDPSNVYGFELISSDDMGQIWNVDDTMLNFVYDYSGKTDRLEMITLSSRSDDFSIFFGFTKSNPDQIVADTPSPSYFIYKSYIAEPDKTEAFDINDDALFAALTKEFSKDASIEHFDVLLEQAKQVAQ